MLHLQQNYEIMLRMQFLKRINSSLRDMRPSEADVARRVLRSPDRVATQSLRDFAAWCGTSDATVLRTCRAAGFDGYQDLKYHALREFTSPGAGQAPTSTEDLDFIDDVQAGLASCQQSLPKAAAMLHRATRVGIVGIGASCGVGFVLADVLCTLGKHAAPLIDDQAIHFSLTPSAKNLVLVAISHSGETGFPLRAVSEANRAKVPTIGLSNEPGSELARSVDLILATQSVERPEGSFSITPRICQLAVLDRLVAHLRGLTQTKARKSRTRARSKRLAS